MQIFVFSKHQNLSAFILFCIDFKRANKQILELGQILSTVATNKYKINNKNLYKPCFTKHPIVLWASKNDINFIWSLLYLKELLNIFEVIRHKHHKTEIIYKTLHSYKNTKLKTVFNTRFLNKDVKFCRCLSNDNYDKNNIFKAYKQYIFKKLKDKIIKRTK